MAPSRHDWKIVDWDVKPQHNQHNQPFGTHKSVSVPIEVRFGIFVGPFRFVPVHFGKSLHSVSGVV